MEKVLLTLIGIIFLTVLTSAQDFGRLQRMMIMRNREMAMRRAGFPFVVGGPIRGPGIASPLPTGLILVKRHRGGSGNIFGQQPTQVFPNVPAVPQIPAAPNTQGQPNDGQQQQGNAGFGQDGNRQTNTQTFRFNGQPGVPTNGDPRMGQQPFIPVSGMNAGFPQAPAAGFPAGPMGPTGGAIFPSQSAQGRVTRQPAPGFTETSSISFTGAPNGLRQQQGPDGVPTFDRSNQFALQGGRLGGFPAGTGFPGMPGAPFPQPPFVGPVPGQGFPGRRADGMGQGRQMFGPTFGFVRPNTAAGPAFSTNTQSSQNFNLQFQPLPGNPNVRPLPEMRPDQNQMGLGGQNDGFSSNTQFVGGMGQTNTQFGSGMEQTDMQAGSNQGSGFTGGATSITSTTTNMGSNQNTDGTIRFDTGNQDTSSLTVSDRTVEEKSLGNNNNEFRIVEVGNVVNNEGLVKPQAADGFSDGMNMNSFTVTETKTTNFQPTDDINAAVQSFGNGAATDNILDLSATDITNNVNAASAEANSAASVASSSSSSSSSSTSSSSSISSSSMSGSPFTNSINKDFSFFMTDNSPAPNDMPPITLPSAVTTAKGNGVAETDGFIDFTSQTDGFIDSAGQTDGFSASVESPTTGTKDVPVEKLTVLSKPSSGPLESVYTESLTPSGDGFTLVVKGPSGTETITFPVTGTTSNEATSTGGDQGFSFSMTSSSTSASSSSSADNSMGDISMGDMTLPASDNTAPPAGDGFL